MITRLYTGDDGQSHFEELDMDSGPFAWGELKSATGVMFRQSEKGNFSDWHTAPRRQFVITLTGEVEIGLADGTLRRFASGRRSSCRRHDRPRATPHETWATRPESPPTFRWSSPGSRKLAGAWL